MESVWPIVLMGAAGLLVGGTYSMFRQERRAAAVVCGVLALVALAGAVLWWWPQGAA
ncbi:hypothetical protein LX16_0998 [Stackebrandtia albiflava]|uniref:Uncharacterized protein n=1 Tax=Stackebrandtia albiflava TaxID=406432 RepID=A0A562VBR0_9ACTN|nr:hypothetical protein [Stackebrandtia albiflava]TWJ15298.1 hypothetical protein LX16_0998 [Stackebrandtia albiflava]